MEEGLTEKMTKKKLHILVMPFPMQGHVNPLLHFSLNLALHGVKVSFVLPHSFKANMDKAREEAGIPQPHQLGLGVDLHFLEIPDVIPTDFNLGPNVVFPNPEIMKWLFEKIACNSGFIEETILRSRDGPESPISCIISDNFLNWTQDVAEKLGIKRIWASTINATTFAINRFTTKDKICIEGGVPWVKDFLPCLDPVIKKDLTMVGSTLQMKALIDLIYRGIEKSFCAVVNSFEGLESYVSDDTFAMGVTSIRLLGPMLPLSFFGMDTASMEASIMGASAHKGEGDCIEWLNTRPPSSVLYIAFGSFCAVSKDQLAEIANGIEKSQQAFLWVLRSPLDECLPLGFLKRSHGLGLVVSWAPQLQVLRHKSIGAYLTHCGWNSTLESICSGVPMLCMPFFADQPTNAILITKLWKVGIPLEKTKVGEDERGDVMMVTKEEVEMKVRAILSGEDIYHVRDHTHELKELARKAIFGSTNDGMHKLIADLQEVVSRARS